jgi:hypothetical protein
VSRRLLGAILVVSLAGCGLGAQNAVPSPTSTLPPASISPVMALARAQIQRAMAAAGLQLADAHIPYEPPAPPDFSTAPKAVFQVVLPTDPNHGFIVVYEFRDQATAATAGQQLATYLATGYGRAQFPPDARHVVRQLQTTLISFSWSPANSPDPNTGKIFDALQTVGTPIDIPR